MEEAGLSGEFYAWDYENLSPPDLYIKGSDPRPGHDVILSEVSVTMGRYKHRDSSTAEHR
jgi:hypothetical protein